MAAGATARRPRLPRLGGRSPETRHWSLLDRAGVVACWAAGILLCLITAGIVIYLLVRGLQYVTPDLLFSHPQPQLNQSRSGGFLDPLIGTVLLTLVGIAIAAPLGVAVAVWLAEYGRPRALAQAVDSGIEIVAGMPSIVLAIFGLSLFTNGIFEILSFRAQGNAVFGRSFLTAGAMMSLIALPLVVGATRAAILSIPSHVREASYAMGKTKIATIRRVLLPGARSGIATGVTLGMGRMAGDTAIVVILLGASLQLQPQGGVPILKTLRGQGSTLTSYVYTNSPAGEGQAPQKAYAAAFVLLVIVVLLNFGVDLLTRRRSSQWSK
ncbi:MAG: phosphate ABC transporter permease PstA [Thermoleophilaceae bacterium]